MKKERTVKGESLKASFIYNLLSEVVILLVPLITTPYVSRVLHEEGVGQYSFSNSIVWIFVLIGTFGFSQYMQREIANVRDNKHLRSIKFWELFLARLITSSFALVLFILLLISGLLKEYTACLIACSCLIFDCAFNPVGFYRALEKFGAVSLKTICIKLLSMAMIFIFVKTKNDAWIYCLCLCGSTLAGNLLMWPGMLKMIEPVQFKEINIKQHFLPSLKLFLPTIAFTAYTMLDKVFIGFLALNPDYENGCYEQSFKIINILTTIATIIGPIMLSRNTNVIKKNNICELENNVNKSLNYVWLVSVPLICGTIILAPNISSWLFGSGFDKSPMIMIILSPVVLLMGISNTLGIQYLLPRKEDIKYGIAIIAGAIINLTLNLILIGKFGAIGASIGTCIGEAIITLVELFFVIKMNEFHLQKIFIMPIKYLLSGLVMFFLMFVLQRYIFGYSIISFFVIGMSGLVLYTTTLLLLKNDFLMYIFKTIFNLLKRKKTKAE